MPFNLVTESGCRESLIQHLQLFGVKMCPFNSPFCLWRPNQNGGMFFCTIGCQKQTATANAQKQQLDVDLKVNPKFLKPKIESRGVFFFFFGLIRICTRGAGDVLFGYFDCLSTQQINQP